MIPNEISILFAQTHRFIAEQALTEWGWPDVQAAVAARREAFAGDRPMYANVLPILTCMALGGEAETAVPLAAAWTLYDLASDIFDDLQDQDGKDWPWNHWAPHRTLNVGLGVLAAAQICLARLAARPDVQSDITLSWGQTFALAARGQAHSHAVCALEDYFRQMAAKSGLIYAAVARAGARLATGDDGALNQMHAFGLALGMLIQLKDDCRDLHAPDLVSDVSAGVYSLPLLYGLAQTDSPHHGALQAQLARPAPDVTAVYQSLEAMGAIRHTLVLARAYQQKALAALAPFPAAQTAHLSAYVAGFLPS